MVYQKLTRLLAPRIGLYFGVMLAFAGVTALLGETQAAVAELIVVGVLLIACGASALRRKQEADRYLKELMDSMDQATRDSTLNCPLPLVMFRPDTDEVVWSNDHFLRLTGDQERMFDTKMSDLAPNFDSRWLLEGKSECPEEVELGHRRYQVFGDMARPAAGKEEGLLATTYWLDVTDLADTRDIFKATRPVLALLLLDNYEDAIKGQDENIRSAMLSEISQRFSRWAERTSGVFCRLDRDRFLFLFEEQYLTEYKEEKFSLLDSVREVVNPAGIPATLSIGVGVDGDTFEELYRFANLSVEMALSRGGDQAVVKNRFTFEFFGGRSKETERRTKVKSRVMASAMGELVADASCVMVMGHRTPDFDAVGAAVGVCAIARMKGVPTISSGRRWIPPRTGSMTGWRGCPSTRGCCWTPRRPCSGRTPAPCWWWWTPTAPSRCRTGSCWTPATRWRSSTTTGGPQPISRGRTSISTSPTPPPPASWSAS